MDGDPAVEPEVDSFSLVLPLPYRVAIIIVLGMLRAQGVQPVFARLMLLQVFGHGASIYITYILSKLYVWLVLQ